MEDGASRSLSSRSPRQKNVRALIIGLREGVESRHRTNVSDMKYHTH